MLEEITGDHTGIGVASAGPVEVQGPVGVVSPAGTVTLTRPSRDLAPREARPRPRQVGFDIRRYSGLQIETPFAEGNEVEAWIRALASGVLNRAALDAGSPACDGRQQDAREFLLAADPDNFSGLTFWCALAGVSKEVIMRYARRQEALGWPKVLLDKTKISS